MIADALALWDFLRKHTTEYSTKSALISWDGTRISGDELIHVQKISIPGSNRIWFYRVQQVEGYEFIYMPVIPSLYVDNGTLAGDENPDARIFRFVGNPLSSVMDGGAPNVKVNFTVIGYKPLDLLEIRETRG